MPPTLCARHLAGRKLVCALRSGAGVPPKGGAPTRRSVRSIFPAAHVAGKNDFILSAASAGNQEGAPAPSWNFPRTEDEGRRPPFYCLLLPVAPTIRLAAKRLRRRDPVPGWLMRLSSTTRRARRLGVPSPRPPQGPQPPNVGARTTRPSPTSSPTRQNALNRRKHPAPDSRPPSHRPP